jgi:hypothetical protein
MASGAGLQAAASAPAAAIDVILRNSRRLSFRFIDLLIYHIISARI